MLVIFQRHLPSGFRILKKKKNCLLIYTEIGEFPHNIDNDVKNLQKTMA
jgi:hypothetical protein